jgi:mannose-6-phosphate isomerase-like protein (cupin superfamily)
MKRKQLALRRKFAVVLTSDHAQAAEMVLPPGGCEGGPDNRHRGADQWLLVLSGRGRATVNRRRYSLRAGTLLVIERGDTHEIANTSRTERLVTVSLYVPPAYTPEGDELPAGKK